MPGIFAFAEARDGELRKVAQEVVTAARKLADGLGTEVHAVALGGSGLSAAAGELGKYGADKVFVGESGIHEPAQVAELAAVGADAILVGESLLRSPQPVAKLKELVAAGAPAPR